MDEAKKKHRPKLANWSKDGFALSRSEDFEKMRQETFPVRDILGSRRVEAIRNRPEEAYFRKPFMIDRISCTDLTPKQFIEIFEEPALPCIITGVPDNEGWPAVNTWNLKGLKRFKDRFFKVGEDDDGYKIKVRMKYFREYIKHNKDDSPLYCFDTSYENDAVSKLLLTEYKIPSYFPSDLLGLVGEKRRPPYRWFLVGPQRSGTCIHVDPLGTSAWNTSLLGRKRWVLFPPTVARSVAKGLDVILKGEDDEAINYFVDLLPRIKKKYPDMLIMEFIQEAGDTVYIPGGWWHSVINIDDTIAITQVCEKLSRHNSSNITYCVCLLLVVISELLFASKL